MGISKKDQFGLGQNQIAKIARCLSHPARIAILELILARKEPICNDIVSELPLAQATISQHLKELKKIGIIEGRMQGTKVCYSIDKEVWQFYKKILNDFFKKIDF
ncbi:MAG: metalloregulator ArsR/SmtB family transcription factor [Spirochaetota bacterium]